MIKTGQVYYTAYILQLHWTVYDIRMENICKNIIKINIFKKLVAQSDTYFKKYQCNSHKQL